jgi:hypothetical protein
MATTFDREALEAFSVFLSGLNSHLQQIERDLVAEKRRLLGETKPVLRLVREDANREAGIDV